MRNTRNFHRKNSIYVDVQRHFLWNEKKWYSMEEDSPQGIWDHIAEKMLLEFAKAHVHFPC